MLSINTNLSSLITQRSMSSSTDRLNQAVERMTTGFKINHAKDNAANYSISTNLTTKIGAYQVAEENCAMGLDMLTTASESLDLIGDKLQRLRALAEQASNGTYGAQSLKAINAESNALVDEINRLYSTAEYNGIKLFESAESAVTPAVATFAMARSATTENYFIANPISYTDAEVSTMTKVADVSTFASGERYSISSVEELQKLADYVNAGNDTTGVEFVLGADIDLSSISNWTPIGDYSTNSNYTFKGTFDGNGHVIKNLTIDNETKGYQGLFGKTDSSSEIKNIGLEGGSVKGRQYTGGLVGWSASSISNSYTTGAVIGLNYVGGLVGYISSSTSSISNSYATGNVKGSSHVGGLVGLSSSFISNSYATGNVEGSADRVGGLVGDTTAYSISNSYATGNVKGPHEVGGLVGSLASSISNCYATGNVEGSRNVGGLVGYISSSTSSISNSYAIGTVTGSTEVGGLLGKTSFSTSSISNSYATGNVIGSLGSGSITNSSDYNGTAFTYDYGVASVPGNTSNTGSGTSTPDPTPDPVPGGGTDAGGTITPSGPSYAPDTVFLQIGISSNWASQVGVSIKFTLVNPDELRMIGIDTTTDFMSIIDEMLLTVSAKQTEYGSAQNRLESALEEISTQYENLVSSRSTIRDADIADVSSDYIRQQILQQASATLMATANQNPSIALQLI